METPSFRPATADDCGLMADWLSNSVLNAMLSSNLRSGKVNKAALMLGLRRRDQLWSVFSNSPEKSPVGLIALDSIDSVDRTANLWFLLGQPGLAGQGLTSSALAFFCTSNPADLHTVTAWAVEGNKASVRCMEKAGFTHVGRICEAVRWEGEWRDRFLMQRRMGC